MRGPGTNEQQIQSLQRKVGDSGIAAAKAIADGHDLNTVTLAYKLMREKANKKRLPKTVTKLLDKLPEEDQETVRSKLEDARTKS